MGRVETKKIIQELRKIKQGASKKYKIDRMLLFGSRARGEELLTSDVDVLVVSPDFTKINFKKRPDFFLDAWRLPVDLEVLCYSPKEFQRKKKELGIVRSADKQGLII